MTTTKKPETPTLNAWRDADLSKTAGSMLSVVQEHAAVCAWYEARLEDALRRLDDEKALRFQAHRAPVAPPSYKGVTFTGGLYRYEQYSCALAARLIADHPRTFTDADHAALLALKEQAERVPTLEVVVREWWQGPSVCPEDDVASLCARLRAAGFDAPRALTAAACVARLVELGAKLVTAVHRVVKDDKATNVYAYGEDVLILPPEAP